MNSYKECVPAENVAGTEMHDRKKAGGTLAYRVSKRLMDVAASVLGLVFLSPLFLLAAILIRHEDGGSAIFSQERVGMHGKIFRIYKFRSMKMSSESDGVPALCRTEDDRLTNVGRFLRTHHLDELPQMWNILKGDMSFVGPRPEREYFIRQIRAVNPDIDLLGQIRPGVFSPATLYNGYTDSMEKMLTRLRMDLDYMYSCSLWFDIKIIVLTVYSIVSGKHF